MSDNINWFNKPENRNLLLNAIITAISFVSAVFYTFIETGYSFIELLSWETAINALFINGIALLLTYAINDWTMTHFRNATLYMSLIDSISIKKNDIEKNKIIKYLSLFIEGKNLERKIEAKLEEYDNRLNELYKNDNSDVKDEIAEIDKEKEDVYDCKNIHEINVKYHMLSRGELLSGSNSNNKHNVDLSDNAKSSFFKKTIGTKLIIFVMVTLAGGITYDLMKSTNFFLLMVFVGILLFTIVSTIANTLYTEHNETIPKLTTRDSLLGEFLEEYKRKE